MDTSKITDYSNFVYRLPSKATTKDYERLSSKLESFVQSSKFLRQGSTIDEYDPETGKRVKRPIGNIVYKQSLQDEQGLPAQQLRNLINRGIYEHDRKALRQASKYRYFSADKIQTQQQIKREEDKRKRKRVLLTSLVLGVPIGVGMATIPFSDAKMMHNQVTIKHYIDAAKLAALGMLVGTGATALIEGARGQ